MYDYRKWQHVFKLDPNKGISDDHLDKICTSGTDAVIVGGTDGITLEKVVGLLSRVRRYEVPCALEISTIDAIAPGFDLYLIPTVLNSTTPKWILGKHKRAIKMFGDWINWREIVIEGYCVLNAESKVARLTSAQTDLDQEDVAAFATIAEKMFRLPIFYIEYSGTYGDPEIVRRAKEQLQETILFYGGGINSVARAMEMKQYADCIVVGNLIYENIGEALRTVQAIKNLDSDGAN